MSSEIIQLSNVFTPLECDLMVATLNSIGWREPEKGNEDRNRYVQKVKQHKELRPGHNPEVKKLSDTIQAAVQRSRVFQMVVNPKRIRYFQFNQYEKGGNYNWHSDASRMHDLRTDFTIAVGLTDGYTGGDHFVRDGNENVKYSIPKGSVLIYPSGVIHKVSPVTEGVRVTAIAWVESLIKGPTDRSLLCEAFQLAEMAAEVDKEYGTLSQTATSLYHNLVRRFS